MPMGRNRPKIKGSRTLGEERPGMGVQGQGKLEKEWFKGRNITTGQRARKQNPAFGSGGGRGVFEAQK